VILVSMYLAQLRLGVRPAEHLLLRFRIRYETKVWPRRMDHVYCRFYSTSI